MQKTKCYLAALVSGVLLVTGILAGCGQSKKDDHLIVYLWENRLMKNIAPYIPNKRSYVSISSVSICALIFPKRLSFVENQFPAFV